MIWNAIIQFVFGVLNFVLSLFPTTTDTGILAFINNTKNSFVYYVNTASWLFPVNTFLQILMYILAIEAIIFTIKATLWALTKVHLLGGT